MEINVELQYIYKKVIKKSQPTLRVLQKLMYYSACTSIVTLPYKNQKGSIEIESEALVRVNINYQRNRQCPGGYCSSFIIFFFCTILTLLLM